MKTLHQSNGWTIARLDKDNIVVYKSENKMAYYHKPLPAVGAYLRVVGREVGQDTSEGLQMASAASQGALRALIEEAKEKHEQ